MFWFFKEYFIDLYYVRVWTQNLRQSRKSSHNSSTNIRCLKTDFFLNEIAQVYLRNMILQKKYSYFKYYYHNFIIVTLFSRLTYRIRVNKLPVVYKKIKVLRWRFIEIFPKIAQKSPKKVDFLGKKYTAGIPRLAWFLWQPKNC